MSPLDPPSPRNLRDSRRVPVVLKVRYKSGSALREAFMDLSPSYQRLITLLVADPPVPYAEISARLGIAVGSIGPFRSRCLDQLRRHPALASLSLPRERIRHHVGDRVTDQRENQLPGPS